MAVVKEKVWKYSPNKQQAQSLDWLHCGELYLHPGCDNPGEKSAVGTRYNVQLSDKKSRVSP